MTTTLEKLVWFCFLAILSLDISLVKATIAKGIGSGALAGSFEDTDRCRQISKTPCQTLESGTCFGVKLPYAETSTLLVGQNVTQASVQRDLTRWERLRFSPKCWAMIQPLLCSVYMPKCDDGKVELPSQESCRSTRSACKIVEDWPEFLKCDDSTKFPSNCRNTEFRELGFNTTKVCMDPMIPVDNDFNYYEGFEGCALKCQDPLYTQEQQELVSNLIFYLCLTLLFLNGGAVVTFIIEGNWRDSFESKSVFWGNFCYLIASIGWLLQFLPNQKDDIVCRKDGTIRRDERSEGETTFCLLVFGLIYFGSLSALQWMLVFAYNLNRICTQSEQTCLPLLKRRSVLIWVITLFALIVACCFGQVGGSSVTGICFPGKALSRRLLVLAPLGLMAFGTAWLLTTSAYQLHKLTVGNYLSEDGIREIKSKILRLLIFSFFWAALALSTLFPEFQESMGRPQYEKFLRESIMCQMNFKETVYCDEKPNAGVTHVVVTIFIYFFSAVLTSSWVWTEASKRIWIRYISMKCKCEDQQNMRTSASSRRNKFIANVFPRRNRLGSQSLQTHEDPVGLAKLLDPTLMGKDCDQQSRMSFPTNTGTGDVSSSDFAGPAVPNFVNRRGGLIPPLSSASCQSDDSRRPSWDAMAKLAAKQLQGSISTLDDCTERRSKRRGFMKKIKTWRRKEFRVSSSSMESNGGTQILPTIKAMIDRRLGHGDHTTQTRVHNQLLSLKKAVIVKELAIQTSFEKLPVLPPSKHNINTHYNFIMCDKATQSSLHNLHEIGTQTKKSTTKKKDKRDKDCKRKEKIVDGVENDVPVPAIQNNDQILELLSPK